MKNGLGLLAGLFMLVHGVAIAGSPSIEYCSKSQTEALEKAGTEAFRCVAKSKDLIEKDFEKLKLDSKWTGTPKSYYQVLFVSGNREFYLNIMNKALQDNAANGVRYRCDSSCPEDRVAYTVFNFGYWPIKPIHFCPIYFKSPEWGIVAHEFGRLYGSIQGETEMDRSNIYVWDRIVEVLCQK